MRGVLERVVVVDRLLVGATFIDRRWAASAFRSWLMGVIGRPASEADRFCMGGSSMVGDLPSCSSTTLGRPAKAYDTMTAMSQLRPLSHREMDMVRALHSLTGSWITTSS